MDPITLALAKKHTNTVALGQGAVPIPGPPGLPGPNRVSPLTDVTDIPDGKLLGVADGKVTGMEPPDGIAPESISNAEIQDILNNF